MRSNKHNLERPPVTPSHENSECRHSSAMPRRKTQNVFRSDVLSSTPRNIPDSREIETCFKSSSSGLRDSRHRDYTSGSVHNLSAIQRFSKHNISSSKSIPSFSCELAHVHEDAQNHGIEAAAQRERESIIPNLGERRSPRRMEMHKQFLDSLLPHDFTSKEFKFYKEDDNVQTEKDEKPRFSVHKGFSLTRENALPRSSSSPTSFKNIQQNQSSTPAARSQARTWKMIKNSDEDLIHNEVTPRPHSSFELVSETVVGGTTFSTLVSGASNKTHFGRSRNSISPPMRGRGQRQLQGQKTLSISDVARLAKPQDRPVSSNDDPHKEDDNFPENREPRFSVHKGLALTRENALPRSSSSPTSFKNIQQNQSSTPPARSQARTWKMIKDSDEDLIHNEVKPRPHSSFELVSETVVGGTAFRSSSKRQFGKNQDSNSPPMRGRGQRQIQSQKTLSISDIARLAQPQDRPVSRIEEPQNEDENSEASQEEEGGKRNALHSLVPLAVVKFRDGSRNLLTPSLDLLRMVLDFGYYTLLCPFKIGEKEGEFVPTCNLFQTPLCVTILTFTILRQLLMAIGSFGSLMEITNRPSIAFEGLKELMEVMLLLCYIFIVTRNRKRITKIFSEASGRNNLHTNNTFAKFAFSICLLVLVGWLSFWRAFGLALSNSKNTREFLEYQFNIFNDDLELLFYSDSIKFSKSMGWILSLMSFYNRVVLTYIELLMWGVSLSLLLAHSAMKKSCFERPGKLDIKKATRVYKNLITFVEKINKALGPLTLAYYIELTPVGVCTLSIALFSNQFQTEYKPDGTKVTKGFTIYVWIGMEVLLILIKIGHIVLTAQFRHSVANFVNKVLQVGIKVNPSEISLIPNQQTQIRKHQEYDLQIKAFQAITAEPLGLTGMNIFKVGFGLLTSILLAVIQFTLFIVEIHSGKPTVPRSNFANAYP